MKASDSPEQALLQSLGIYQAFRSTSPVPDNLSYMAIFDSFGTCLCADVHLAVSDVMRIVERMDEGTAFVFVHQSKLLGDVELVPGKTFGLDHLTASCDFFVKRSLETTIMYFVDTEGQDESFGFYVGNILIRQLVSTGTAERILLKMHKSTH